MGLGMSNLGFNSKRLLHLVRERPGIHLREAQRRTGLGLGDTVYQLQKLTSLGLVDSDRIGKYKRYYPADIGAFDRKLCSALQVRSRRRILLFLLANQKSNLSELASGLRLSKSTINWHLRTLQSDGIVTTGALSEEISSAPSGYRLTDPKTVTRVISRFRLSTIDKLTDSFLRSWDLLELALD